MEKKHLLALTGLLQIASVILGFFALAIVMKMNGYPLEWPEIGIRWRPLARTLRESALLLMIFPALWLGYCLFAVQKERGVFTTDLAIFLGILFAVLVLLVFLYAAQDSFKRPLLMYFGPPKTP
jgi:hypothetical protein